MISFPNVITTQPQCLKHIHQQLFLLILTFHPPFLYLKTLRQHFHLLLYLLPLHLMTQTHHSIPVFIIILHPLFNPLLSLLTPSYHLRLSLPIPSQKLSTRFERNFLQLFYTILESYMRKDIKIV